MADLRGRAAALMEFSLTLKERARDLPPGAGREECLVCASAAMLRATRLAQSGEHSVLGVMRDVIGYEPEKLAGEMAQ
jgi:hypothetical protein